MKGLTIEEKAKRYGEALERAKKLQETCDSTAVVGWCEYIFPELKESEREEIRKKVIEVLKLNIKGAESQMQASRGVDRCFEIYACNKVIAWLEKQGEHKPYGQRKECEDCQFNYAGECKGYCQMKRDEQKPTDNVEPEFHEGDWVVYDHSPYQVVELPKEGYINLGLRRNGKVEFAPSPYCRHWTIRDAKDGDVLISSNKQPFVYNGNYATDCLGSDNLNGNYTSVRLGAYFGLTITGELLICDSHGNNWTDLTGVQPATEEERNALFKELHDSDYKWDGEKKELWHKYL